MKNYMISVRIPESLLAELKETAKKDHYMDVSEAVRSIMRNSWLKSKDPISYQIEKLKNEIFENLNKRNQDEVLKELREIRDTILRKDSVNKDSMDNPVNSSDQNLLEKEKSALPRLKKR